MKEDTWDDKSEYKKIQMFSDFMDNLNWCISRIRYMEIEIENFPKQTRDFKSGVEKLRNEIQERKYLWKKLLYHDSCGQFGEKKGVSVWDQAIIDYKKYKGGVWIGDSKKIAPPSKDEIIFSLKRLEKDIIRWDFDVKDKILPYITDYLRGPHAEIGALAYSLQDTFKLMIREINTTLKENS